MVAENNAPERPSGDLHPASADASSKPVSASSSAAKPESTTDANTPGPDRRGGQNKQRNRNFDPSKRGGRGGRGGRGDKRKTFTHEPLDRRQRNNEWQDQKRRKIDENGESVSTVAAGEPSFMSIQFPEAEITAEERRPKRKVAVMIGYAGTGYHGLQINHKDKTIEGDIFAAFVAAKAISKANANDPRKSSFVRCARTDKGVHAAGNMLSLKLIIEDPDIVKKINDELPPQIRVWGIQRTNNAFSCYQSCDSRWYEYLMPSYCLLPPHPESFIGKKVQESVTEKGVEAEYAERLNEVKDYWVEVEKNDIQPILDSLDPETREAVRQRMHSVDPAVKAAKRQAKEEAAAAAVDSATAKTETMIPESIGSGAQDTSMTELETNAAGAADSSSLGAELATAPVASAAVETPMEDGPDTTKPKELSPVDRALKEIKAAYVAAKRRYRATPERISRLQEALDQYVGTKNYHNYTIQKSHADPSSKRLIKSFVVNPEPIQINDTQWLSLKVHGQSFMMHQIRKMVGMAVLVTRCGTPLSRMDESYMATRISIPKAPGLGLLLERPVFGNYNKKAVENLQLQELDFGNYEKEIQEFKESQIYNRIFDLEEKENSFHTFFHQIDNFKSDYFLWVTAGGIDVAHNRVGIREPIPEELEAELGDEGEEEDPEGREG
ncbi:Uu.00g056760.m01.CDS01 [Anthostomella pinea]|uniref:tRNA pseudouridine synthase 1 n=1 Tax=Anthostomella pinea TaxID=933095 RepID=A0AAI8VRH1_9PEZI|nr:Uu.00g056760.m01.CDS01 [Anthostomella pinea]